MEFFTREMSQADHLDHRLLLLTKLSKKSTISRQRRCKFRQVTVLGSTIQPLRRSGNLRSCANLTTPNVHGLHFQALALFFVQGQALGV
jgi:hypothetical protein